MYNTHGWLNANDNKYFWELSERSMPTDEVFVSIEQTNALLKLLRTTEDDKVTPFTELYLSNNIPKMDIVINFDEALSNTISKIRVYMFDESIRMSKDLEVIGMMILRERIIGIDIGVYLALSEDKKYYVFYNDFAYRGSEASTIKPNRGSIISKYITKLLETWCLIQLAFLNPTMKNIFNHPKKIKKKIPKLARENSKVTKYVNVHHIADGEIEEQIKFI